MNQEKVGKFILKLRLEKDMTQKELGDKLGVSYKAVSKWENGVCLPDASLYDDLCKVFGITKDELFAGKKLRTKLKKFVFLFILYILLFSFIMHITSPKFYDLIIDNDVIFYTYVSKGIITDGFLEDSFFVSLKLNKEVKSIGLFVESKNGILRLLEAKGGSIDYVIFYRNLEKTFQNGNIIDIMLKNKDNLYVCVSEDKEIDELTIDDCYNIQVRKSF